MLVDVVAMRHDGVKLSEAQVRSAARVRGQLAIRTEPWQEPARPDLPKVLTAFASLKCKGRSVLPELRRARVTHLRDDSFVVVGLQREGRAKRARDVAQAWSCWLVPVSGIGCHAAEPAAASGALPLMSSANSM